MTKDSSRAKRCVAAIDLPDLRQRLSLMSEIPSFELFDGLAVFRPRGQLSLTDVMRLVKSAIAAAREQRLSKLIVVGTEIDGLESPSIAARHFMAREWAEAAQGVVRLAVVIEAEMIDPHKFGVAVARNFGMTSDVFDSEAEAIAWLRNDC